MKNTIIIALYLPLIVGGCSDQSRDDAKGYREFDTTYAHCVEVFGDSYGALSLSCIPKETK